MKLRWPNQRRRTAGLLAIIRFGALPIGLVSQGLAGRLLGLGDFGRFAVVLSLINTLAILMGGGLADAATREVAALRRGAVSLVANAAVRIALPVSIVWIALGRPVQTLMDIPVDWPLVLLVGVGGLARALLRLIGSVARGSSHLSIATLSEVALVSVLVVGVMLPLYLADVELSLLQVVGVNVGGTLAAAVVCAIALAVLPSNRVPGRASGREANELVTRSVPLFGNQIALLIGSTVALWVVSATLSAEDAGAYSIAARIAALATIPGVVIQSMAGPDIAAGWRDGTLAQRTRWLRWGVAMAASISAAYLLAAVVAWEFLVGLVFDLNVTSIAAPLAMLGLAHLVNVATGPGGQALIMTGFERLTLRATSAGAVVTVVSLFPLVWLFGLTGAAVATALGVITTNLLNAAAARSHTGLTTWAGPRHTAPAQA